MDNEESEKPHASELPAYVLDPLDNQSPDQLETIAAYATELAAWKRGEREHEQRERRKQSKQHKQALEERDFSTDPTDYDDPGDETPPSGAYVTIKETKPGYQYYYWQWREGETWKNRYIAPVSPDESSE
jgi:hypothetical protein